MAFLLMLAMKARSVPYVTINKLMVDVNGQFGFQGHG